jgi:hypothetical protein
LLGLPGPFQLPHRICGIRDMLVALAPMGLSDRVCKEYHVCREELELLAIIEEELTWLKSHSK